MIYIELDIQRAKTLLAVLEEREAFEQLATEIGDKEAAFFAVQAAAILLKDRLEGA